MQPGHHSPADLQTLKRAGTQVLAYLSLGEDTGPPAPWQRPRRNPDWGGHYVHLSHPGWHEHVLNTAAALFQTGFGGLFLDTLDTVDLFPEERDALLELVTALRRLSRTSYLMANRGFALLPELASRVDGLLFESFSSAWRPEGGYGALAAHDLRCNARVARKLRRSSLELYALDYADSPALAAFARARARRHGLVSAVSDRHLTRLEAAAPA